MIAQLFVFSAVLAVSMAHPGGIIGAAPLAYAAPAPIAVAAAPLTIAHAPVAYAAPAVAAPVAYAAPAVAIPAPVAYSTGVKIAHTYTPVEQHGYKIHY